MFTFELSTFAFQIVNFLILLLVLSRFLYRPLVRVMKEREAEVASRLREADERQARADEERQELAHRLELARQEANEIAVRARIEASRQAEELLERARQQAQATESAALQRLRFEEDAVRHRLEQSVRGTAVGIAGSLIRQVAGPAIHQELLERVLDDGIRLDGVPIGDISHGATNDRRPVRWELAFPPAPDLEARLRRAIVEALGQPEDRLDVELVVDPGLIAGSRLVIGTLAVDLSLKRTLEDLNGDDAPALNGEAR